VKRISSSSSALVILLALAACASAPRDSEFSFALIGDLGYTPAQQPLVDNVFADLNAARLAFVVHDGDLGSPRNGSCTNELWARRLAQFQASAHPLIYTPGDNEWTDCHAAEGAPGFEPLERLAALRATFFNTGQSLGRRPIAFIRQRGYPENARWEMGGITFMTLHVVGSNNNRGRTRDGDAEYAARNAADIAWLREGFAAATAAGSRAVMIIQQANIFPQFPPFPGGGPKEPSGYTELRDALEREAIGFRRPVVLVHGDSHYFRVDKPLGFRPARGGAGTPSLENFTRVETFGAPNHHWVQVLVSRDDPNVFTFRPRLVEGNIQRRSP
jgi:hypothetical protein